MNGCFVVWDDGRAFDIAFYFGIDETLVEEVISYCCCVGLFNKLLRTRYNVLTSAAIQKRYVEMCKRAKRANISIPANINLIGDILTEECPIVPVISDILTENSVSLPQSKVKESKEEKNINLNPHLKDVMLSNVPGTGKHFFENWFILFNYAPYPDSEVRCKSVWDTLNADDRVLCYKHTLEYVNIKKDENRRHNPLNYLQKRMFDITSPHFFGLEKKNNFTHKQKAETHKQRGKEQE